MLTFPLFINLPSTTINYHKKISYRYWNSSLFPSKDPLRAPKAPPFSPPSLASSDPSAAATGTAQTSEGRTNSQNCDDLGRHGREEKRGGAKTARICVIVPDMRPLRITAPKWSRQQANGRRNDLFLFFLVVPVCIQYPNYQHPNRRKLRPIKICLAEKLGQRGKEFGDRTAG